MLTDHPPTLLPLPLVFPDFHSRISCDTSQILTSLPRKPIHNLTVRLCFETDPEVFYTIPLIREHHDSYLYYIDIIL